MTTSPLGDGRALLFTMFGRPMTLRRGASEAGCIGVLTRYKLDELVGTLRQGDARVELLASDLTAAGYPVPPRNPDELRTTANSWTVVFAAPVYEGETLIGWSLTVRGG